ncbi:MAG: hypothetical protein DRJ42_29290 [Deltaproteobacteria bacterium]|nr:MAG: hypothetical protein DRJ42_29290 [Deltaproteobacteria bacterium]
MTVTDEIRPGALRAEPADGIHVQYMVGLSASASEEELLAEIIAAVAAAVDAGPFSESDRDALRRAIDAFLAETLGAELTS